MLRLASDADVHGEIIRGLRRRVPEIDLVRAQDALPSLTNSLTDADAAVRSAATNAIQVILSAIRRP